MRSAYCVYARCVRTHCLHAKVQPDALALPRSTAEMAFNGSSASSGRWIYPDLWCVHMSQHPPVARSQRAQDSARRSFASHAIRHTFTVTLPPYEETIQFVMVDTETLTSEQNQFPGWANLPNLYYPPPPANFGRRRLADAQGGDAALGAGGGADVRSAGARRLRDFDVKNAPPISTAQWEWVQHTLSNSTADWIIVIGNDPIWSVGEHGPTWALAEKLLPLLESAGVALYISGRDPIAQHLTPSPAGACVDFVGIGNGANCNASQAAELPNQGLCPDGALAFSYGASTGFVFVQVTSPTGKVASAMTVTFYDDTGAVLYNFSKPNPRAYKGYVVTASNSKRTLMIMAALFLAVATTLCGVAGSSYVRAAAAKRSFASGGKAGGARARRGVTETTPLVPLVRGGGVTSVSLSNL